MFQVFQKNESKQEHVATHCSEPFSLQRESAIIKRQRLLTTASVNGQKRAGQSRKHGQSRSEMSIAEQAITDQKWPEQSKKEQRRAEQLFGPIYRRQ